ncbi:unnamed protein product, partial [Mesorhabditis belari]|uniref:ETFB lysine methyltransferase n=1 Tax=Mesorhabditis belari TaxID=2138241 RepID=A0AAF3ECE2_9BILA
MKMLKTSHAAKWILRNTRVSSESLTQSIKLHLITEACPLWMSTPEQCPFPDPYWAFYWPGGQALTKFILENPRNSEKLFLASAISGAKAILANDIDKNALLATLLNYRLNRISLSNTEFSSRNFVDDAGVEELRKFFKDPEKSLILLGDMFYDSDFASTAFKWLKKLKHLTGARVLVGDPDRHPLAEQQYLDRYETKFTKRLLTEYSLPGYVTREHYGFATAKILEIDFR